MIDLVALLVREFSAEPRLAGVNFYGYAIPPDKNPPLAVVSNMQNMPFTTPSTVWWDMMVVVDVHSEDPKESETISQTLLDLFPTFVGAHPEGVLADCRVQSSMLVIDDGWTPTRYRHVVTVDVTARNS